MTSLGMMPMRMFLQKSLKLIVCLGLSLGLPAAAPVRAQEAPEQETLLESDEDRFDPVEVLERLEALRRCPLDPNRATFSQLEKIPYLSALQIQGILIAGRERSYTRLEDLLRAPGMDHQTLARVRPFLKINPRRGVRGHLRSRAAWTLPLSRAYREGCYWGDATAGSLRLHLLAGDLLWMGVVTEKDPGERDLTDHHAFFLQLSQLGPLRRLLLGHFALEYGQGLTLWTAAGASANGGGVSELKRKGRGIRPHTSTEENGALFGGALSAGWGAFTLDLFGSRTGRDAGRDTTRQDGSVTGLSASGLHRTDGELAKKNALQETLTGARAALCLHGDKTLGLTWYRALYRPGIRPADPIRQRYALQGCRQEALGADLDLVLGALEVFAEAAVASSCGALEVFGEKAAASSCGVLAGICLRGETVRAGIVWRHYPADFLSARGSAAAAKDGRNEDGLRVAMRWDPAGRTRLELQADGFRRPWRSYDLPMPSTGERWTLRAVQRLSGGLSFQFRLRWKREDASCPAGGQAGTLGTMRRCDRRIQIDWQVAKAIALRSRLETSRVSPPGGDPVQRGVLLAAQVKVNPDARFGLKGGAALFRVPAYEGRLYLCEVGPRGMARNVALFGRGMRTFALLEGELLESVRLSLRFAATVYDHCRTLSSGLDEIDWNVKREITLQLDWSW